MDHNKNKKKKRHHSQKPKVTPLASLGSSAQHQRTSKKAKKKQKMRAEEAGHDPAVQLQRQYAGVPADCLHFGDSNKGLGRAMLEEKVPHNKQALHAFQWLIAPVTVEEFYRDYWEKKPLVVIRSHLSEKKVEEQEEGEAEADHYYGNLFQRKHLDDMIANHEIRYTDDINVTRYENDTRTTLDPQERATHERVQAFLDDKCSIRTLCPQRFYDHMWKLLFLLEEHWGSGAGTNIYLTPGESQGFAPHYDDIEAFLMQTAGRKDWRVYKPRTEAENLDRFPSPNFKQHEIGDVYLEVSLRPGDLLYFPRGWIHQGTVPAGPDSMHITVSTGLMNTWHDLLQHAVPAALQLAANKDSRFRESLPRNYFDFMGAIHTDREKDVRRTAFIERVKEHMQQAVLALPFDGAADQMARSFLHSRLPVPPSRQAAAEAPTVVDSAKCRIRLLNNHTCRVVFEEEEARLYHCLDNDRLFRTVPPQYMAFSLDYGEALGQIISAYPKSVQVSKLQGLDTAQDKVELAQLLVSEKFCTIVATN